VKGKACREFSARQEDVAVAGRNGGVLLQAERGNSLREMCVVLLWESASRCIDTGCLFSSSLSRVSAKCSSFLLRPTKPAQKPNHARIQDRDGVCSSRLAPPRYSSR